MVWLGHKALYPHLPPTVFPPVTRLLGWMLSRDGLADSPLEARPRELTLRDMRGITHNKIKSSKKMEFGLQKHAGLLHSLLVNCVRIVRSTRARTKRSVSRTCHSTNRIQRLRGVLSKAKAKDRKEGRVRCLCRFTKLEGCSKGKDRLYSHDLNTKLQVQERDPQSRRTAHGKRAVSSPADNPSLARQSRGSSEVTHGQFVCLIVLEPPLNDGKNLM